MNKINFYLFKLTYKYILLNTLVISILILFINSLEISRANENKEMTIVNFLFLSILKLPTIVLETVTFVIIISIAFLYRNLINNNELISIRNIGLSIIDVFKPVSIAIFTFGLFLLLILNPITTKLDKKFHDIIKKDNINLYTIKFINDGMWIKNNLSTNEKIFISIPKINLDNMTAQDIKILHIKDKIINLFTSSSGKINDYIFELNNVNKINIYNNDSIFYKKYFFKINFNENNIIESLINYKHIPFYKYKKHIENLKKFNLYSSEVSLFYLSEIIKPFFLVIIGFVVMGYSGKFKKNENFFRVLFISILIGFLFFLLKEIIVNFSIKLNINFILTYSIILLTPLIIGCYQIIEIETD